MNKSTKILSILLAVCAAPAPALPQENGPGPRIVVGPNILVSRNSNLPHVEMMIAANPRNPKNLLGAAMSMSKPDGSMSSKTYASFDGGYTWFDSSFAEQLAGGGADSQVAFSPHGTALFAAIARVRHRQGRSRWALHFYRSEDGGRTWLRPLDLGTSYDHPQVAVDQTHGRHAGRIYVGVLCSADRTLGLFRSDDDGRSFVGPVKVIGDRSAGGNITTLMVLGDGTLVVTYTDFKFDPARRDQPLESDIWLVKSVDGGVTFSAPVKVTTMKYSTQKDPLTRLASFPLFAADTKSKRFRDRLYAVWSGYSSGSMRIFYTYSADGGKAWAAPRPLDNTAPEGANQFTATVAVNDEGKVGVMWLDTRGLKRDDSEYNAYFTTSLDGGESFLPPVRLSSSPSLRWGAGNMAVSPDVVIDEKGTPRIFFVSVAARWSIGGDYLGLTADSEGVFHPLWADSRTGTFQVYSGRVRVEDLQPEQAAAGELQASSHAPQDRQEISLTDMIEFVADPATYDAKTGEMLMPIRLKNISGRTIYKPITIRVKGFEPADGPKQSWPLILNSTNGKQQQGAVFDYSSALRDLDGLEPDRYTEAVVWRLKLTDPLETPAVQIEVRGNVSQSR
jgi:hypothetical protein